MITGPQIRAARALLGWSSADLASASDVGVRTIARIEAAQGVPNVNLSTIEKLRKSLEAAGIEFIGSPDEAPGVRIHAAGRS